MSTQISVPARELPIAKASEAVQTKVQTGSRLLYIDNLRVFLTILVVIHHLAITYGADGGWFYHERPTTMLAGILLTLFTGWNQFYFMGLFFLIAGYFVPGAIDRKGTRRFLKDRFVRLGIPFALFAVLVAPFLVYINGVFEGWWSGTLKDFLVRYWSTLMFDSGPLWFVETLLVFSAVYALGRAALNWLKRGTDKTETLLSRKPLSHQNILASILVLALVTIVVRVFSPIGETWHNWQLAFYPQYILLFAAGILAYRRSWLDEITDRVRKVWSGAAVVAIFCLPLMMAAVVMMAPEAMESNLALLKGGINPLAIITAVWEAVYCLAMPVLLLSVFRKRFNQSRRLSRLLADNAYTVYIIHAPVIVATALLFRSLALDPLLKFALVAPLAVALCFLVSHFLVRRLPLADQVL